MVERSVLVRLLAVIVLVLIGVVGPRVSLAAMQGEEEGLVSETEYESPQFGYTVEWEEPWEAQEGETESSEPDGYDILTLDSDQARVQVFAFAADGADADDEIERLIDFYAEDADAFEEVDRGGDEELAAAVVEYEIEGTLVRDYTEVRLIDGGDALLTITLFTPVDEFADELESAQEAITLDGDQIFAGLDLVDVAAESRAEATAEPTEEPEDDAAELSPEYRGGLARTGEQPGPVPESEPEVLWTYETGDDFGALSPAIAGGHIFFGPNALYGVQLETGELDFSIEEEVGFAAPMAIADGVVYAAWEGGALYAVDAESGEEIWIFETGDPALIGGAPAVSDGRVFFGTFFGDLFAIDAESGEVDWQASIGSSVAAPAVVDGIVYIAGGTPATMYAFDAESGDELWSAEYGGGTTYGTQAVVDGMIYVANDDGTLYALDADDGSEVWTAELGNVSATGTPAVVDGVVYALGDGDQISALDAEDGAELWTAELGADGSSQPVVANGTVIVGDADGGLHALDGANGEDFWSVELDDAVEGSPVILDGVIYVDSAGTLYALGEE